MVRNTRNKGIHQTIPFRSNDPKVCSSRTAQFPPGPARARRPRKTDTATQGKPDTLVLFGSCLHTQMPLISKGEMSERGVGVGMTQQVRAFAVLPEE